ncbi:MAG: polysaccharide deacetylase family protein [Actinomycetota bacterium]|nr:polysaccharide deacetylase family protein [Actinomycetota bacterium]
MTIDDGWVREPTGHDLLVREHPPVTLFLTNAAWRADRLYFRDLVQAGGVVADHTMTHPDLTKLSYARQKAEICQAAAGDEEEFGVRPTLFRPPFGAINAATLRAAADCGMGHVVLWSAAVNDGRVDVDGSPVLRPGDIVLMHFRTTFHQDLTALFDKMAQAGLKPARLEDYLSQRPAAAARP